VSALPVQPLFACHVDDTHQGQPEDGSTLPFTWRDMPLQLWAIARFAVDLHVRRNFPVAGAKYPPLDRFRALLMFASEHPSRRKRVAINVDEMVQRWVPIIRGLSAGHDKDEIDRCEYDMERHIWPLLSAPVSQLRAFYAALVVALKEDRAIPMFVWTLFESWGEAILKKAPDGEVIELKKAISLRIADMVEKDIHLDLKEALCGALQGRSAPQLEKIEHAVQSGAKPRLRGKESCLFLVVNEGTPDEAQVML
jgi:hypothetical protein